MSTTALSAITPDHREKDDLSPEEEQKIVSILIDSSLFMEMSLADRKKLVQYLLTMYY